MEAYTADTKDTGMGSRVETWRWLAENSRACPQCCTLIERDDGCNKVDCTMCGNQFCWLCMQSWQMGKCGFYRCVTELAAAVGEQSSSSNDTKRSSKKAKRHESVTVIELGVPDVEKIQSRI